MHVWIGTIMEFLLLCFAEFYHLVHQDGISSFDARVAGGVAASVSDVYCWATRTTTEQVSVLWYRAFCQLRVNSRCGLQYLWSILSVLSYLELVSSFVFSEMLAKALQWSQVGLLTFSTFVACCSWWCQLCSTSSYRQTCPRRERCSTPKISRKWSSSFWSLCWTCLYCRTGKVEMENLSIDIWIDPSIKII